MYKMMKPTKDEKPMSNISMREVQKFINSCTNRDDLRALNKVMKNRFDILTQIEATVFKVGDMVAFKTKHGTEIEAVVRKVNRKTITAQCGSHLWKVSPSLLRIVEAA
jgi:hypothetical protein